MQWVGLQPFGQKAYNTYEPLWFEVDRIGGQARDVKTLEWEEGRRVERMLSKLDVYE